MKRRHQVAVTALMIVVFIVWQAPASVIGIALRQASQGVWDLADAEGSLWTGQGVITGRLDKRSHQVSLPPLGWAFDGFHTGGLLFKLQAHRRPVGQIQIGWHGWQVQLTGLAVEARVLTPLLPDIFSKGDWQGLLNFQRLSAQGDRHFTRLSQLDVEWLNAASGLMTQGTLGSFVLSGRSEAARLSFSITSHDGPLVLSGRGSHSAQQGFQFDGELTDNAGLTSQFPGFLGDYLQPTGEPNRYNLRISRLNL